MVGKLPKAYAAVLHRNSCRTLITVSSQYPTLTRSRQADASNHQASRNPQTRPQSPDRPQPSSKVVVTKQVAASHCGGVCWPERWLFTGVAHGCNLLGADPSLAGWGNRKDPVCSDDGGPVQNDHTPPAPLPSPSP